MFSSWAQLRLLQPSSSFAGPKACIALLRFERDCPNSCAGSAFITADAGRPRRLRQLQPAFDKSVQANGGGKS